MNEFLDLIEVKIVCTNNCFTADFADIIFSARYYGYENSLVAKLVLNNIIVVSELEDKLIVKDNKAFYNCKIEKKFLFQFLQSLNGCYLIFDEDGCKYMNLEELKTYFNSLK